MAKAKKPKKSPLRRGRKSDGQPSSDYELVEVGRELERKRITTELHDGALQTLVGIKLDLETMLVRAKYTGNPEDQLVEHLTRAVDEVRDCVADLRALAMDLAPPYLESAELVEAFQRYLDTFARRFPDLDVVNRLERIDGTLSREQKLGLFRILQEALSNAGRHARASRVEVELKSSAATLSLSVYDNGRGMAETANQGEHFGLQNMRNRAAALGGALSIQNSPSGVHVQATIPLRPRIPVRRQKRGQPL